MKIQPGTLYLVGTPIGNLEDMTIRAISVLQQVAWIAAEDTRHTKKLLQHFEIPTPQISYHDHNRIGRIPELTHRLQHGEAIALVTDAGMPGISDPGYELVKACVEIGVPVVPIPGVSAVTTALTASGLPSDRFVFEGFLPAKRKDRDERLAVLQSEPRTIVVYEAPHHLLKTLEDLRQAFGGDRPIVAARELTKLYEEFWRGSLTEAIAHYTHQSPQGEFTLVIAGATPSELSLSEATLKVELQTLIQQGLSRSQASRQLAQQTALPRKQLYQLALTLPGLEQEEES
jgi:16S rRNA (cytidine1402-2'-O)-methyltransferase